MATATVTRQPSDTLLRLLDDELVFSPVFRRHYSSHLAMALVALDQMGADPAVLQQTFDAHAAGESEARTDWELLDERLGEIERDGIVATVRRRVPDLVAGPASQLFHPMIRLAYGLEAGHAGQVAAALLDWERRHVVLPVPDVPHTRHGARRLADVAAELSSHAPGTWDHSFDLVGIAQRGEIADALDGLAIDDQTLDDISSFALAAHTTADDFVTLHLVTGARALRVVSGWVDEATSLALAANAVPAMAVAYAAVAAPPLLTDAELERRRRLDLPDGVDIAAEATRSLDPHVIKLANVALAEEQRSGDQLYRYVAARVVGLAT